MLRGTHLLVGGTFVNLKVAHGLIQLLAQWPCKAQNLFNGLYEIRGVAHITPRTWLCCCFILFFAPEAAGALCPVAVIGWDAPPSPAPSSWRHRGSVSGGLQRGREGERDGAPHCTLTEPERGEAAPTSVQTWPSSIIAMGMTRALSVNQPRIPRRLNPDHLQTQTIKRCSSFSLSPPVWTEEEDEGDDDEKHLRDEKCFLQQTAWTRTLDHLSFPNPGHACAVCVRSGEYIPCSFTSACFYSLF